MGTVKFGYMCAVDFEWELDEDASQPNGVQVYTSLEELRENRKCVNTCGIVKVKIILEETIQESNYRGEKDDIK